jgi:hypothetical protein
VQLETRLLKNLPAYVNDSVESVVVLPEYLAAPIVSASLSTAKAVVQLLIVQSDI